MLRPGEQVLHNARARFAIVGNDGDLWLHQTTFMKTSEAKTSTAPSFAPEAIGCPDGGQTTQSTVARMESGRTLPSMRKLSRYAEATGSRAVFRLEKAAA